MESSIGQETFPAWNPFHDALETLEAPAAEMAALDSIHHEQQFFLVAQLAQAEQIFGCGWGHAAFALDSFDENRNGGRTDGVAHGLQVVVRHMAKTLNHRLKTLFDLVLAGGGNAGECAAMEGIHGRQDFETSFIVAKFTGQLVKAFIRLGAAVAKENFARGDLLHDCLRQASLRLVVVKV